MVPLRFFGLQSCETQSEQRRTTKYFLLAIMARTLIIISSLHILNHQLVRDHA
jgi:hypothetical protein